jgi:putative membrane protein
MDRIRTTRSTHEEDFTMKTRLTNNGILKTTAAAAVSGLLLLVPGTLAAQQSGQTGSHGGTHGQEHSQMQGHAQGQGTLTASDQKFVREAAQGGMMEVQLGQLAQQNGASAEVKDFGRRMVQDHTQANTRLKTLATDKGLKLPTEMSQEQKQHMQQLSRLSGAEFDRMYMDHMVKDHKKDVSEFEKESKNGGDLAVRAFATETLPTLRQHLELAQQIDAKQGNASASRSGS